MKIAKWFLYIPIFISIIGRKIKTTERKTKIVTLVFNGFLFVLSMIQQRSRTLFYDDLFVKNEKTDKERERERERERELFIARLEMRCSLVPSSVFQNMPRKL